MVFLVKLDQLEGGAGAVAFFFGELVPFVETAFAVLYVCEFFSAIERPQALYLLLNGHLWLCCASTLVSEFEVLIFLVVSPH
jgi:hypothetical protein